MFGLLTNLTPFWFHVVYHKYILRSENAGKPGFGPYPPYYDHVVSRTGIRGFCRSHGFRMKEERGMRVYVIERNMRSRVIRSVAIAVSALSMGRLPWRHNNLIYVLQKNGAH